MTNVTIRKLSLCVLTSAFLLPAASQAEGFFDKLREGLSEIEEKLDDVEQTLDETVADVEQTFDETAEAAQSVDDTISETANDLTGQQTSTPPSTAMNVQQAQITCQSMDLNADGVTSVQEYQACLSVLTQPGSATLANQ